MSKRIVSILVLMTCLQVNGLRPNEVQPLKKVVNYEEECKFTKCVPKCCPEGKVLLGHTKKCKSKPNNKDFSEVPLYNQDLEKTGRNLTDLFTLVQGKMASDPLFHEKSFDYSVVFHNHVLTEDGILYEEQPNMLYRWVKHNTSNFCLEYMKLRNVSEVQLKFYTKFNEDAPAPDDPVITAGLLLSCIFLALVMLVYALLRELRNLSGMVLMAYVGSLFGAFLLLAVIKIIQLEAIVCKVLTFSTYFFFLASFCWMNIMSCDIWWTFRGYAKARPIHRRGECFKFCMYCIYAWGLPALLTIPVVILNELNMRHMPWFVTPKVPLRGCFFGAEEKLLYLYIPMLFLILCNWVFFLMTAFNIWRLHRATAVLDSAAAGTPAAHRSQQYRFLVYLKLSVIMGVNWLLEVVSSFSPHFKGWYISDVYNMLIGLSIFLIFVCKKKIVRMLIKRLRECGQCKRSRKFSRSRSRSSNTTASDVSTDVPICVNPKGSLFFDKH